MDNTKTIEKSKITEGFVSALRDWAQAKKLRNNEYLLYFPEEFFFGARFWNFIRSSESSPPKPSELRAIDIYRGAVNLTEMTTHDPDNEQCENIVKEYLRKAFSATLDISMEMEGHETPTPTYERKDKNIVKITALDGTIIVGGKDNRITVTSKNKPPEVYGNIGEFLENYHAYDHPAAPLDPVEAGNPASGPLSGLNGLAGVTRNSNADGGGGTGGSTSSVERTVISGPGSGGASRDPNDPNDPNEPSESRPEDHPAEGR